MKEHQPFEFSQNLEKVDQQIRIENLKDEVKRLTKDEMITWEEKEIQGDIEEKFWQQVLDYEKAPSSTYFKQLLQAGFEFHTPEKMDDRELKDKLWKLIHKLAQMRVFLHNTDHLSDRELYINLYIDILHEDTQILPPSPYSAFHIDLVGTGSEEDIQIYLKYYADHDSRKQWQIDFPNEPVPDHEYLPYDRDRLLPQAYEELMR